MNTCRLEPGRDRKSLRDHRQDGNVAVSGIGNLARWVRSIDRKLLLLLLLIHTILRIVLANKQTTATQQVTHRHIKCQSRLWSRRGTKVNGHIMVTTRYSEQQGSKSRQKVVRLYKHWNRPISKRFIKPPYSLRAASIDSDCCRLPTTSVLSNKADKLRSNQFWSTIVPSFSRPHIVRRSRCVLIFLLKIRKIEISSWWSRRASQHPAVQSLCILEKVPRFLPVRRSLWPS